MQITKLGHCCLLIEINGVRLLTDPGYFSVELHQQMKGLQAILITHEHADHFHLESLKVVLEHNPTARIITNGSVGKLLDGEGIEYEVVEDGGSATVEEVIIEGYGQEHALIYSGIPGVMNTGYFIAGQLFYPGDAFYDPGKKVEILALPVLAPWLKLSEALDYAKKIKPRHCFPVHDGFLNADSGKVFHMLPEKVLTAEGINFHSLWKGDVLTLDEQANT